jgi:hypothetical protein
MGNNIYMNPEKWMPFINGHWQKEMPTKVGTYPTASRQGERAEDRHIIITKEGKAYALSSTTNIYANGGTDWTGWWWSEPYPELPKPPEWEAVDVSNWGTAE